MLKQRLVTALLLIPALFWAVLSLADPLFAALVALVVLAAGWEWGGLLGTSRRGRVVFVASLPPLLWGCWLAGGSHLAVVAVTGAGAVWWLIASLWLLRNRLVAVDPVPGAAARAVAGWLTLLPAALALLSLHRDDHWLLLYLLALTTAADSGAYFAGRRWGRAKLAPAISPGKTWAGLWGGLAAVALLALVGWGLGLRGAGLAGLAGLLVLSLAVTLFSVAGDLVESRLKRAVGVKDSGSLLPGHGGVLDRVDSLTAAAPLFWLGWHGLGALL